MNWKVGLDKYLTSSPPDDGFDDFIEETIQEFSETFFKENEDWIMNNEEHFSKLFYQDISPKEAAIRIERMFKIFKK